MSSDRYCQIQSTLLTPTHTASISHTPLICRQDCMYCAARADLIKYSGSAYNLDGFNWSCSQRCTSAESYSPCWFPLRCDYQMPRQLCLRLHTTNENYYYEKNARNPAVEPLLTGSTRLNANNQHSMPVSALAPALISQQQQLQHNNDMVGNYRSFWMSGADTWTRLDHLFTRLGYIPLLFEAFSLFSLWSLRGSASSFLS